MKILSFILFISSATLLSACSLAPESTKPLLLPTAKSELNRPIPTADFKATDKNDQQLIDELNQVQDKSLDKEINDIDLQL